MSHFLQIHTHAKQRQKYTFAEKERQKVLSMCFLTCCYCNCVRGGGHTLAHMIICCNIDTVHLATDHVVHGTVCVIGGA